MSTTAGSAIVIGAGIVGAACARELVRAGTSVTVLDAGYAGGGTTAAGMGHLVAMDDSPEQLALTALSVRMWHELRPSLGGSVEFDSCGTIWVAEREEHMAAVREKADVYRAHGLACEVLTPARLAQLEPNLRLGVAGAMLVPGDAVLYPPGAALALLNDARTHGATVREACTVDEVSAHAVRCGSETLHADVIVNAAGARAAQLTPGLPIVPRKGHLAITDRAPGFVRHQLVELGYLASAHQMTSESVAFNVQPRTTARSSSVRRVSSWAGTRARTDACCDRCSIARRASCPRCRDCPSSARGPDSVPPRRTSCRSSAGGIRSMACGSPPVTKDSASRHHSGRRASSVISCSAGPLPLT